MNKYALFLRHTVALIREDKLFSVIYVAGTAVAIASAMVIAIVLNIKLADIPPESNRSRTLYVSNFLATESVATSQEGTRSGVSTAAIDSVFRQLKCVEVATGILSDGQHFMDIANDEQKRVIWGTAMGCDPDFFKLYNLDFISGRPFSEKEFQGGERVCVVSERIAKKLEDADHFIILDQETHPSLHVVGIVKTVSPLMENARADIYVPYKVEGIGFNPTRQKAQFSYSGNLSVRILLREGYSREDFLEEIEPLRQHYNAVISSQAGEKAEWEMLVKTHFFSEINFSHDLTYQSLSDKVENLLPPAILMLLFLLLPAINLSGLVSNRMEARRAEMGIRKAFGAKRRELLNEVINENLVLTLLGGAVGWVLSWFYICAIRNSEVFIQLFFIREQTNWDVSLDFQMFFTPTLFLIAFLCCATLNLMAALIPAWASLRKPIVESLNQKR